MKQYCVYVLLFLICIAQITNELESLSRWRKGNQKLSLFDNENVDELEALEKSESDEGVSDQSFLEFNKINKPVKKPVSNNYDPDQILQQGEKLDPVMSDWLKISSPQFKNTKKFPPILLHSGEEVTIKLADGFYRINTSYKKKNNNGAPDEKYFWFRLSGRNLYYSLNKQDMNVLGSIYLKDIQDMEISKAYSDEPTCFFLIDNLDSKWKLCAENMPTKVKWVCRMKTVLGQFEKDCEKILMADSEITVLTKKVTQPIIMIPLPQRSCNENWDWARNGDDWECDCKEGKEQSPIDLPLTDNARPSPVKPIFQYDEILAKATRPNEYGELKSDVYLKMVLDNGILKIKNKFFGKIVTLDGSIYAAEEIVFHTPSEHKINGKQYDMEMQVIHTGQTSGDIAKYVILSFLFEKKPGSYNKFLDDVDFFSLPNPSNREKDIINNLYIPKVLYSSDSQDLPVMKPFSFYTYQGSLTVPPCTERTIHYVAAKPIPIGNIVIQLFQEASRLPDMMDANGNVIVNTTTSKNNRKTQETNGRSVYYYDFEKFVGPEPPSRPTSKPDGHYEKLQKKLTEYFYVNSEKPSGLPGSFVVSESEAKGN
jgi:carbonic anhydrase